MTGSGTSPGLYAVILGPRSCNGSGMGEERVAQNGALEPFSDLVFVLAREAGKT